MTKVADKVTEPEREQKYKDAYEEFKKRRRESDYKIKLMNDEIEVFELKILKRHPFIIKNITKLMEKPQ